MVFTFHSLWNLKASQVPVTPSIQMCLYHCHTSATRTHTVTIFYQTHTTNFKVSKKSQRGVRYNSPWGSNKIELNVVPIRLLLALTTVEVLIFYY